MTDLKSKPLIVLKGLLFLAIACLGAAMNLMEERLFFRAVALLACVWAACRFYYFLFYVLEKYVDPSLRYAGILAVVSTILRNRR